MRLTSGLRTALVLLVVSALLLPAAGAHAIYNDGILQRCLRDTQVMATHVVADWDQSRESYARSLLDLPVEDPAY